MDLEFYTADVISYACSSLHRWRGLKMIFLSKLLPLFIYPLGLTILFILISIILLIRGRRAISCLCLIVSMLLLLASSSQIVAYSLAKTLEEKYPPVDGYDIKTNAIVILGGTVRPAVSPRTHVELGNNGERVMEGLRLYRSGVAPVIIATGGGIDFIAKDRREGEDIKTLLTELGVPPNAILAESESRNTHENAVMTRKIFDQYAIGKNILLVTSAIHMPRSVQVFVKEGFTVIPAPADHIVSGDEYSWYSYMPQVEYLELSTNAIKEWIGIAIYWVFGWL